MVVHAYGYTASSRAVQMPERECCFAGVNVVLYGP